MRPDRLGIAIAALSTVLVGASTLSAQAASVRTGVDSFTFISPSIGWVKVGPTGSQAGTLYRTTDGGERWTVADRSVEASMFVFGSPTRGEALVSQGAGMCQNRFTAVATNDNAATWLDPSTLRVSDGPSALGFVDGRPLFLNGSCAGSGATLFAPGARGVWHAVRTFSPTREQAKTYMTSPIADGLAAHGASTFAAIAYSAQNNSASPLLLGYRSTNGGCTWSGVALGSRGLPATVRSISFTNARSGIAAAEGPGGVGMSIYTTANGGRTWTRTYEVQGATGAALDMVTPRAAYGTFDRPGKGATLMKTTDGGRTWTSVRSPA